MRIAKVHIILIIIAISFTYSTLIIILFSYLHSSLLGLSSSLFSFLFLLLIGYHFLNYFFYRNYSNIVSKKLYLESSFFRNKATISFNYNADYFKNELKIYLKNNYQLIRGLEFINEVDIIVMSKIDTFLKWEEIIICKITRSENNHTNIEIFYNFDDDGLIENFIFYFKKLDDIDLELIKN